MEPSNALIGAESAVAAPNASPKAQEPAHK